MKKKIVINKKLVNHLMINGEKKTSETIFLKSIKKLHKNSKKQPKKILQLAIINSSPIFKLHRISNKKKIKKSKNRKVREIPAFLSNTLTRESMAIKFILSAVKKQKLKIFNLKLKEEIILAAKNKSNSIDLKTELQKQVLSKKHFFRYYRWK